MLCFSTEGFMTRRAIKLLLLLLLVLLGVTRDHQVLAADQPEVVVTIPQLLSPAANKTAPATLNGLLPPSQVFKLKVALPPNSTATGSVELWAKNGGSCNAVPTNPLQHYTLTLTRGGTVEAPDLFATIPALQIGQAFCMKFSFTRALTTAESERVSKSAADSLAQGVFKGNQCFDGTSEQEFLTAIQNAAQSQGLSGNFHHAARLALHQYLVSGETACKDYSQAADEYASLQSAHRNVLQRRDTKLGEIKTLPKWKQFDYPLLLQGTGATSKLVPLDQYASTINNTSTEADLAAFLKQLEDSQTRIAPAGSKYEPALMALISKVRTVASGWKNLVAVDRTKSWNDVKAAVKDLKRDQKLPPAFLCNDNSVRSWENFVDNPYACGTFSEHVDALNKLPPHPNLIDLRQLFSELNKLDAKLASARKGMEDARKKETDAKNEFNAAMRAVFSHIEVRNTMAVDTVSASTTSAVGHGLTPDAGNYVSVDAGVAVALGTGSEEVQGLVLPYLGFNIYFTPVDRKVPFEQQAGSEFLQRFSVTLGTALYDPELQGRKVEALLGKTHPLVGLGLRLSQYTRCNGGVVLYQVEDPNPAIYKKHFFAAPYLALSLDLDVYRLLSSQKL